MQKEMHLHSHLSSSPHTDLPTVAVNSLMRNGYICPERQQQQSVRPQWPHPEPCVKGPSNLIATAGKQGHPTRRQLPHLRLTHHQMRGNDSRHSQ